MKCIAFTVFVLYANCASFPYSIATLKIDIIETYEQILFLSVLPLCT